MLYSGTGQIAIGFMASVVSGFADKCPESEKVLLPAGLTVKEIYRRYKAAYIAGVENIQERRFYQLWGENFPNVVFQKVYIYLFHLCYIVTVYKVIIKIAVTKLLLQVCLY